jgi:hypothetical protein
MLFRASTTCFLLSFSAAALAIDDAIKWVNKEVFDRIDVTGNRRLGLHFHEVSGDAEAFNSLNYFGQGGNRFTDFGSMHVTGRNVAGLLNFQMQIQDRRAYDPQGQRISLNLDRGPVSLAVGDIHGSLLNTNEFIPISRSMKGGSVQLSAGRLTAKVLRSEPKGSARTVSIQGLNSAGPYYLQSSQILRDSVQVRLDGQQMRLGQDYTVSYEVGAITFRDRIISPTSSIVVTYETLGFNAASGTLEGVGAKYDMGAAGQVGVTLVQQKARTGGGLNSRIEQFEGFGAPSTPYFLQFEPLASRPIIVKVDGILQAPTVDYHFDELNPVIFYFHRFVPSTSIVEVAYTPRPTTTVDGDRSVAGFDYRLPLGAGGKNGFVSYSQALGRLGGETPMSGTARGIKAQYASGRFEIDTSIRDVPQEFVSVESRGFNRNERGMDFNLRYGQGPMSYAFSHGNSSISLRTRSSAGDILFSNARTTHLRGSATFSQNGAPISTLEHSRSASSFGGRETKLDTTALSIVRTLGKISLSGGLEHQEGFGPLGQNATQNSRISLDTIRLNAAYSAGPAWSLGARASVSAIRTDGKSSTGSDLSLNTAFRPNDRFSLESTYASSSAGQLAALSAFQSGLGYGYGGNGFSGGISGPGFNAGAPDMRLFQVISNYRLSNRISLDGRFVQTRTAGSISSNTDSTFYGAGLHWDIGNRHFLSGSFNSSQTKFLGSANRADARTVDFSLQGAPPGPWSYRLGATMLLTGGTSEFKQDSFGFDVFLGHRLNDRQRLSFSAQTGMRRGYLPQNDYMAGLFYEYRLFENISLVGSYKLRNVSNLNRLINGGAYRSSGFDLELSFSFAP